ncbi:MAG: GH25 family lysozyme [Oscillospiraceae bacterium]
MTTGRSEVKMIYGIDVSRHNGKIDWKKVGAAGKSFAFIRIGWSGYDGEIHLDERFIENMHGASEENIKIGIYVYAYNKTAEAGKKTAAEIVRIIDENHFKLSFPIAFDVEETTDKCLLSQGKAGLSNTCLSFCREIAKSGFVPILYSYTAFLQGFLDMQALRDYDCWVADYREPTGTQCPYLGKHTVWQYRGETGRCDGVVGACDLNVCYKEYGSEEIKTDYRELFNELCGEIQSLAEKYKGR